MERKGGEREGRGGRRGAYKKLLDQQTEVVRVI